MTSSFVRIGDFVTFKNIKVDDFLSAEGILTDDIVVGQFDSFDSSLFQICLPRQYSASKELAEFLRIRELESHEGEDLDERDIASSEKHYEALLRGQKNEKKMNETYMKNKFGSTIRYGDTIQLLHVKSKAFITTIGTEVATYERENIRVCLHPTGTSNSWFVIQPRFKINQTGDFVLSNSEIKLNLAERPSEFLHGAEREFRPGYREVNASLEPTSWLMSTFQSSSYSSEADIILATQLIYLHDPETQSVLTIFKRPLIMKSMTREGSEDHAGSEVSDDDSIMDISEVGEIVIEKMGEFVSSSALWFLETRQITVGGRIPWKLEMVRLRHANTGLYMAMYKDKATNKSGLEAYKLAVSSNAYDKNCLFNVHELHSTNNFLYDKHAVQISHGHTYLARGDMREVGSTSHYVCKGSTVKAQAVYLFVNKYTPPTHENEELDVLQPLDVVVGGSIKTFLERYMHSTYDFTHYNVLEGDTSSHHSNREIYDRVWKGMDNDSIDLYFVVVERAIQYLHGMKMCHTGMAPDGSKFSIKGNKANTFRQNLFRELGILEIILYQINIILPLFVNDAQSILDEGSVTSAQGLSGGQIVLDASNNNAIIEEDTMSNKSKNLLKNAGKVAKNLLKLILSALKANRKNQSYIAPHIHVILGWVGTVDIASDVVREMLSDNLELQQNCIGAREIKTFINQLTSPTSKMNPMYFTMLKSFCSCSGHGISRNQGFVMQAIYSVLKEVFITVKIMTLNTSADDKIVTNFSNSLYVPRDHGVGLEHRYILGQQLISEGYPVLAATWNAPSNEYSTQTLFAKSVVSIAELFKGAFNTRNKISEHILKTFSNVVGPDGIPAKEKPKPRKFSVMPPMTKQPSSVASMNNERRIAVGQYLIAQLYLAAELCLDRNYLSISQFEKIFSFEILVTIISGFNKSLSTTTGDLKGAAASLLTNLYVDRESETTSHMPCLSRIWSDLSQGHTNALPCVEKDRVDRFCILQHTLSEHIKAIDVSGGPWEPYSLNMMQLLRKLVELQFYGTEEKLIDVIYPLLNVLDRTNVPEEVKKSLSMRSKSISRMSALISDASSPANTFYQLFAFLDTNIALFAILALAAVTTALAIVELVLDSDLPVAYFQYVYLIITIIFCIELLIRFIRICIKRNFKYMANNLCLLIDVAVVALDIIVIITYPTSKIGNFSNSIRLLRIVNVYLGMDLVKKSASLIDEGEKWVVSKRYTSAATHELQTMVEIVDILNCIQKIIDERNFVTCLKEFGAWCLSESGGSLKIGALSTPVIAFEKCLKEATELRVLDDRYYHTVLDLLMYDDPLLVQSTLTLIIQNNSIATNILENIKNAQILSSAGREHQYHQVHDMILQLDRNIETHALWCNLLTEKDKEICNNCISILKSLLDISRTRLKVLQFDEDYTPDGVVQKLLRNFGCFEVCFKLLNKLSVGIKESTLSEAGQFTRIIMLHCNNLLYWYCLDNPVNQRDMFDKLEFFMSTVDININSHRVMTSIFRNNEPLMKKVPLQLVTDFADKICKNGKFPQYLTLLSSICFVKEKNILENQYEIVKQLASPNRIKKITAFFCSPSHSEYAKKVKLMAPYLNKKDIGSDDLASDLSYHLELMKVLTSCTMGFYNIATIETKVQQMFHFADVVDAVLDPQSILLIKIRSGLFFYNSMLDVEMVIPGLGYVPIVWKLLHYCLDSIATTKDDLRQIERNGWEKCSIPRQKIEFSLVCIMIVKGFFKNYFDPVNFRRDHVTMFGGKNNKNPDVSNERIQSLINGLYERLKQIYDLDSPVIGFEHKDFIYKALEMICKAKEILITDFVEMTHVLDDDMLKSRRLEEEADDNANKSENKISHKLDDFIAFLDESPRVKEITSDEFQLFIKLIEELPSIHDKFSASKVRYEPLINKLVQHVKGCISFAEHGAVRVKYMTPEHLRTSFWVVKMFRTMIENRWGMTIYQRDDEGGEEQDEASHEFVSILNDYGATTLCLDLIAPGIDLILVNEAIKLLVAMLFQEGGNLSMQQTMHKHLADGESEFFFQQIRNTIQQLISWHDWRGIHFLAENADPDLPEEIITIRCIQLMCEGHFMDNQNIFREQPHKNVSINILDDLVAYLVCCGKFPCRTSSVAALSVSAAILEVIQGPCEGNQMHFALNTTLVETLNRQMRARPEIDCVQSEELELKKTAIDILQGLLEGQGKKVSVYERVLSVIHLDVVQMMCMSSRSADKDNEKTNQDDDSSVHTAVRFEEEINPEVEEISITLQTEALVLLQMLCDFKPSLRNELEALKETDDSKKNSNVACVEVLWRGELQRRFFNIPSICEDFTDKSKSKFVEFVDRSTQENKLLDMYERTSVIYHEILHQQWLRKLKVNTVFSIQNQNRITWVTFVLTCAINATFVAFYGGRDCLSGSDIGTCGPPTLADSPRRVVDIMNTLQIIFSACTLIMFLVVRCPVNYIINLEKGQGAISAVINTALDPLTLYYFVYVFLALLSVSYDHILTILLLDVVVKNSYAMDVCVAVFTPMKQLLMAIVLCVIVMYIFSIHLFIYLNNAKILSETDDCANLYNCFKFVVGYGATGGITGMNEYINHVWLFSFAFDICIRFVLLNVIRGITVDTFSALRISKLVRLTNTTETCFICGVDKQVFDRSRTSKGFKHHIKHEHNMWNYLYFMIYIWEQDKDDDDGLEQYVRRCIDSRDIAWLPSNIALCLNIVEENKVDAIKSAYLDNLNHFEENFNSKVSTMQSDLSASTTQIEKLMNQLAAVEEFLEMPVLEGLIADSDTDSLNEERNSNKDGISSSLLAPDGQVVTAKKANPPPALVNQRSTFKFQKSNISSKIFIEIVEINGLALPPRMMENIVVKVCSPIEEKTVSEPHLMLTEGGKVIILVFTPPKQICVCNAYESVMAINMLKIQIAKATSATEPPRYLGHVLLQLGELTTSSNVQIEKSFVVKYLNDSYRGNIVINATYST